MVKTNRDAMQERAPRGQEAVVNVYLSGHAEPIIVEHVETRRDYDFPWVLFIENEPEGLHFVREDQIARIEIAYRSLSGKHPIGFGFGHALSADVATASGT
jgi:hypothetical protein